MKKFLILSSAMVLGAMNVYAEDAAVPAPAHAPPVSPAITTTTATAPATAELSVLNAYAFATAPGQTTGAVFLTLVNNTPVANKLTSASTDVAASADLHTNMIEEDAVTMIKVDGYDIAPGQTLELEPSGHHIMLTGLNKPLVVGETFTLKLVFSKKGEVSVDVTVRPPGEQMMDHTMHNMDEMDTSEAPAHTHEEPR